MPIPREGVERRSGHGGESQTGLEFLIVEYQERHNEHCGAEDEIHPHHERRRGYIALLGDAHFGVPLVKRSHRRQQHCKSNCRRPAVSHLGNRGLVEGGAALPVKDSRSNCTADGNYHSRPEARIHKESVVMLQESTGHICSGAQLSHSRREGKNESGNKHPHAESAVILHIKTLLAGFIIDISHIILSHICIEFKCFLSPIRYFTRITFYMPRPYFGRRSELSQMPKSGAVFQYQTTIDIICAMVYNIRNITLMLSHGG